MRWLGEEFGGTQGRIARVHSGPWVMGQRLRIHIPGLTRGLVGHGHRTLSDTWSAGRSLHR
jgi:hypothetical protein